MESSNFYDAAIPTPWRILGLKLQPFSLGHILLLNKIRSPFVVDNGKPVTGSDLIVAIRICSMPYEQAVSEMDTELWDLNMNEWGRQIFGRAGFWGRFKKPRQIDWPAKIQMFHDYIEEHSQCPTFSYDEQTSNAIDCPAPQLVKVSLLSETSLSESQILNRPWSLSMWDYVTLRCLRGHVDLLDGDKLTEAQEQANQLFERMNRG